VTRHGAPLASLPDLPDTAALQATVKIATEIATDWERRMLDTSRPIVPPSGNDLADVGRLMGEALADLACLAQLVARMATIMGAEQ